MSHNLSPLRDVSSSQGAASLFGASQDLSSGERSSLLRTATASAPLAKHAPDASLFSDTPAIRATSERLGRVPRRVLWSSAAWSNGIARTLTGHEQWDPYDDKLYVAAGEGRRFEIDGHGVGTLAGNRSRIYMHAPHRDAEIEFYATATDSKLDDMSVKMRSRHQESGPKENRFGGYGVSFDFNRDRLKFQVEYFHNDHDSGRSFNLPRPIDFNKKYGFKVRIEGNDDDSKALVSAFIDYDANGVWTPVGQVEYARTGYLRNDLNALYMWIRGDANGNQRGIKLQDVVMREI